MGTSRWASSRLETSSSSKPVDAMSRYVLFGHQYITSILPFEQTPVLVVSLLSGWEAGEIQIFIDKPSDKSIDERDKLSVKTADQKKADCECSLKEQPPK